MSFLHKRYSGGSSYSNLQQSSGIQSPSQGYSIAQSQVTRDLPTNSCEKHPLEILRHMCLECSELLCPECITVHLESHRLSGQFPTIVTLKNLKNEMNQKIEALADAVAQMPSFDTEIIQKKCVQRVDQIAKELINVVSDWTVVLKGQIIEDLGIEKFKSSTQGVNSLSQELNSLRNAIGSHINAAAIKRVFQIDADKLSSAITKLDGDYKDITAKADFRLDVDWQAVLRALQQSVRILPTNVIPPSSSSRIRLKTPSIEGAKSDDHHNELINPPGLAFVPKVVSSQNLEIETPIKKFSSYQFPMLHNIKTMGQSNQLMLQVFTEQDSMREIVLAGSLSSLTQCVSCLFQNGSTLVISGGPGSTKIIAFDLKEGKIIKSCQLQQPRLGYQIIKQSSNKMFILGGRSGGSQRTSPNKLASQYAPIYTIQRLSVPSLESSMSLPLPPGISFPFLSCSSMSDLFIVSRKNISALNFQNETWRTFDSPDLQINLEMKAVAINETSYDGPVVATFYVFSPTTVLAFDVPTTTTASCRCLLGTIYDCQPNEELHEALVFTEKGIYRAKFQDKKIQMERLF